MSRSIAFAFMSCALGVAVAFSACGGTQPPLTDPSGLPSASALPADPIPSATTPAAITTPPVDTSAATAKPPVSDSEMAPPLVLNLTGPSPVPAKGDIKLSLDIVANGKINGTVTLTVKLPAGATMKTGTATETLQIAQVGTMKREYVVHTTAALSAPIVVTADNAAPGGASGFHAERQFPTTMEPTVTPPKAKPPVPRPTGTPPAKSH